MQKKISVFLLIAVLLNFENSLATQTFNFVFMADSRGDSNQDIINTSILTPMVNSVLSMNPAPSVVIYGGDGAYRGGTANLTQFKSIFTTPIENAGIPTVFVIGNHETYTTGDAVQPLDRQKEFQAMFNSRWTQNGPSGYHNLAFSFEIGNSLFVITDNYYATDNSTMPNDSVSSAQANWISSTLSASTAPHKFVFGHAEAFSPYLPSQNSSISNMWDIIKGNAAIYFCGHEHLYYRTLHDGTYEVLAGDAGAPPGLEDSTETPQAIYPTDVYSSEYNYATIGINGRYITVTALNQNNQTIDWFQFFDNSGASNSTISNYTNLSSTASSGILAANNNTIANYAAISNVNTGIDATHYNNIANYGSISFNTGGNGIHVYNGNSINNAAGASISGSGSNAWGIWVDSSNSVSNSGSVVVSGSNSVAFLANGSNNSLNNSGTLQASGSASYAVQALGSGLSLTNSGHISGSLLFSSGINSINNSGTISGSGYLFVAGGSLSISGPLAHSGGTYIYGASVTVSSDSSLGAASGGLYFNSGELVANSGFTSSRNVSLNGGTSTFTTNGDVIINGTFSGTGGLTKSGAASLSITGGGTYSGSTLVTAGTLNVTGGFASQDINIYSGAALSLSTSLNLSGSLKVNGSLTLPGLSVQSGASLSGAGTIYGNLTNSGTFSPGNSPGTIAISGNYSQNAGTLYIEVTPTAYDKVQVSGTTTINGGALNVSVTPGYYANGLVMNFIDSQGGITGSFDSVSLTNPSQFLSFSLASNGSSCVVTRIPYSIAAVNRNSFGAGTGLYAAGLVNAPAMAPVISALDFSSAGAVSAGLNQMSAEPYSALSETAFATLRLFSSTLRDRVYALRSGPEGPAAQLSWIDLGRLPQLAAAGGMLDASAGLKIKEPAAEQTVGLYVKPVGQVQTFEKSANRTGFQAKTFGLVAGADARLNDNLLLGAQIGYAHSDLNYFDPAGSKGAADYITAGVYASFAKGGFYADGLAQSGLALNRLNRKINLLSICREPQANFNSFAFGASLAAGYDFKFDSFQLGPLATLDYGLISNPRSHENNAGDLGLKVSSNSANSLKTGLGARASAKFRINENLSLNTDVSGRWGHEFANSSRAISAGFNGSPGSNFSSRTASPSRDSLLLDAGVTLAIKRQAKVFVRYSGELFGRKQQSQGGAVGLKWEF